MGSVRSDERLDVEAGDVVARMVERRRDRCVAHESVSGRVTMRCAAPSRPSSAGASTSVESHEDDKAANDDRSTGDPELPEAEIGSREAEPEATAPEASVPSAEDAVGAPSLAGVVATLRDALAAAGEVAGIDAAGLCGEVVVLEELRRVIDVAEGARLAELDKRDATATGHGLVTHRWLAREAKLPAGVARDRVKVGVALRDRFDRLGDAVEDGKISWEHAKAIVSAANPRVLDDLVDLQDGLVELADATVFERWRREISGIVTLIDADGGHDPTGDDPRTKLSHSAILDGALDVRATLVGDDAATFATTIETVTDELYRRAVHDHETCPDLEIPTQAALRAKALVEVCRRAMARDIADTRPPRPELILVTHASDPLADVATVDGAVLVQDGTRRFATAAQRRALAIRDGGCVFPGCDAPLSWVEAHHINPHHRGGDTDTDEMANACGWHHHHVAHGQGWTMGITADGWTWFTSPSGHTFWGQRHGRQRTGPPPPGPSDGAV